MTNNYQDNIDFVVKSLGVLKRIKIEKEKLMGKDKKDKKDKKPKKYPKPVKSSTGKMPEPKADMSVRYGSKTEVSVKQFQDGHEIVKE